MRYPSDHKEQTHRKIVETASRQFRSKGYESVGISKLMQLLNLTHGGFYAHFEDKDDLTEQAAAFALEESLESMSAWIAEGGLPLMIEKYLSLEHVRNPEFGCPLPTLSLDVARQGPRQRTLYQERAAQVLREISAAISANSIPDRQRKVHLLFAILIGGVTLARIQTSSEEAESVLRDCRTHATMLVSEK